MKKIIILFLLIGWVGVSAAAETFPFSYQKNIDIGENPRLILKNKAGAIEITGAAVDNIEISAVKNIKAADQFEAERMAEYIEIKVSKSGDRLTVETVFLENVEGKQSFWTRLLGKNKDVPGSVDFKITVPFDCGVNMDNPEGNSQIAHIENEVYIVNSKGRLVFSHIKGPVFAETISADMNLSDIDGDISLISSGSDMELESITGRIQIKSTSGSVKGRLIDGPIEISSTSGTIEVAELTGDIKITTTSGSVKINQESGGMDITTHDGDVVVAATLDSDRGYFVSTRKGNISFNVPETASGSVKLETKKGGINTELPLIIHSFEKNKLVGDFGAPGPQINLSTESGDITLGLY